MLKIDKLYISAPQYSVAEHVYFAYFSLFIVAFILILHLTLNFTLYFKIF